MFCQLGRLPLMLKMFASMLEKYLGLNVTKPDLGNPPNLKPSLPLNFLGDEGGELGGVNIDEIDELPELLENLELKLLLDLDERLERWELKDERLENKLLELDGRLTIELIELDTLERELLALDLLENKLNELDAELIRELEKLDRGLVITDFCDKDLTKDIRLDPWLSAYVGKSKTLPSGFVFNGSKRAS